jgi:hypothetical protein
LDVKLGGHPNRNHAQEMPRQHRVFIVQRHSAIRLRADDWQQHGEWELSGRRSGSCYPTQFTGRVAKTAKVPDLLGRVDDEKPWKQGLPRMIFVSDMGDALSAKGDFKFLKSDVMPSIRSAESRLAEEPENSR